MSDRSVLLLTRDLFFRAKLEGLAQEAGYEPTRSGPAVLAVVELTGDAALARVRELVVAGSRVIAFGSHVQPAILREARAAGATAVPNSEVEETVRRVLFGA
ncbi:MAG: hypothetical protein GTN62_06795 [Gemmatimonadales bacterium]|nr:hypothetical protein [Gemmatimonadales bacterium]NIN11206.1 hypothetical protein [Gemmatimonadales bacterium]NIN49805.1 hypothetical protein [Gemmatimonadales bacterium]NIP07269.1 hypothetical protein [Gemmatimonadales bacterium]NIR02964.1 hypothetical protein [Gemmatimonadales bacterium]